MPICPGQDKRFWKPDDIFMVSCPECGTSIEFWKDDPKRKCPKCKKEVTNPKLDLSCAKWCKYAKECLGQSSNLASSILYNLFIKEMEKLFSYDQKHINHTLAMVKYADKILLVEGGNPLVVKAATIFLNVGRHIIQNYQNSSEAKPKETDETIQIDEILEKLGVDTDSIEQISQIIAHYYKDDEMNTLEFKIVWDSEKLANLSNLFPFSDMEKTEQLILHTFKTRQGRYLANKILFSQ